MENSVGNTESNDHVNVDLDLSSNGRFGAQRRPKPKSVNAPPTPPIMPKVEVELDPPTGHLPEVGPAVRAPPTMSHPPPQVEGVVSSATNAPPPPPPIGQASQEARTTTGMERREAALRVAPRQMKSQRMTITALQMEGGSNNNDVNAASQAPVLRQQAAAVGAMNIGRRLSAGAGNVGAGRGRIKVPRVYTRGAGGNGETMTVRGFLHRFDTLESVSILCVCHGLCHTPAQFVEHAGGGAAERARPLRHIVVVDADDYFAHLQTPSSSPSSSRRPF